MGFLLSLVTGGSWNLYAIGAAALVIGGYRIPRASSPLRTCSRALE